MAHAIDFDIPTMSDVLCAASDALYNSGIRGEFWVAGDGYTRTLYIGHRTPECPAPEGIAERVSEAILPAVERHSVVGADGLHALSPVAYTATLVTGNQAHDWETIVRLRQRDDSDLPDGHRWAAVITPAEVC